ncbi:unnamed protein product [Symbiodinium sp. CCMP2592]|nr:unnamed protein product [Symbiodinium sp. CCMP2592]
MGKSWKPNKGDKQYPRDGGAESYYRLWRGAYSPRAPWRNHSDADYNAAAFPSYTQVAPKATAPIPSSETKPPPGEMQLLQKAVTTAKKAENKVRKVVADRETNSRQWDQYLENMKNNYIQEFLKHQKDQAWYQEELESALTQQETARQAVKRAIQGEPTQEDPGTGREQEIATSWQNMRDAWERPMDVDFNGVIQRAMESMAPVGAAPVTGPKRLRPEVVGQFFTPEAFAFMQAQAGFASAAAAHGAAPTPLEPFPSHPPPPGFGHPGKEPGSSASQADTSGGAPPQKMETSPAHPGMREPGQHRVPTYAEPPRSDVKTATKVSPGGRVDPHGTLAQKLDAKRQQELQRTAMQPFGIQRKPPETVDGQDLEDQDSDQDLEELHRAGAPNADSNASDCIPRWDPLPPDILLVSIDVGGIGSSSSSRKSEGVTASHSHLQLITELPWRHRASLDVFGNRMTGLPEFTDFLEQVGSFLVPLGRAILFHFALALYLSYDEDFMESRSVLLWQPVDSLAPLVSVSVPVTPEHFLQTVVDNLSPRKLFFAADLDFVEPQPEEGFMSLLLVPQWLEQSDFAEIIFDFSAVGGPVYAAIVAKHLPHAQVIEHASMHTESPWDAFQTGQSEPLRSDRRIRVVTGDTIKFVAVYGSPHWYPPSTECLRDPDFLSADIRQIVSEEVSDSWLILAPDIERDILHSGQPDAQLKEHAASALHCRGDQLMLCIPDKTKFHPFVHQGALLAGVIAARQLTPSEICGAGPGVLIVLDCRPVGRKPTFFHNRDPHVGEAVLHHFLDLRPPRGFQLVLSGLPRVGDAFWAYNGSVLRVDFEPSCLTPPHGSTCDPTDTGGAIAMRNPYQATGGCQGVPWQRAADVTRDVHPPARFDDEARTPPPVAFTRERPQGAPPATFLHGHFLVFAPRYRAEVLPLVMRVPCAQDDALNEIQEARNEDQSLYFDTLLPVEPQPDNRFACILSLPEWATTLCHVLVDLRQVDGRLFSITLPERLSRASLLAFVALADAPRLRIFLADRLLPAEGDIVPENGGLITFVPEGRHLGPLYPFDELLGSERNWTIPCPMYPGPIRSAVLIYNDDVPKVISYEPTPADTLTVFRRVVASFLGYDLADTILHPSNPAIEDVEHFGYTCKSICVATRHSNRPTSGEGHDDTHIVILDTRPILRDIEWLTADQGRLDFDGLCARFDAEAPQGHPTSIKGGRHELRAEGTLVHVPQAGILVVQYIPDFLENSPTSNDAELYGQEQEDAQEDSESTCTDSSDPSDDDGAEAGQRERPLRLFKVPGHPLTEDDFRSFTLRIHSQLIDGRLFAYRGRTYADRFALLHLAGLPHQLAIDVYVGQDLVPLPDGTDLHLTPGVTVRFVPAGLPVAHAAEFADCLRNPAWWSLVPYTVAHSQVARYGLVLDGQIVLHETDVTCPTRYKHQIATCIGLPVSGFTLCPANPRTTDCAINGHPVRAIIGIVEGAQAALPAYCALVDCRPQCNGWFTISLNGGRIDAWELLDNLDMQAPRGWRSLLVGHPSSQQYAAAHPGSVFVAEYAPSRPAPIPLLHGASHDEASTTPLPAIPHQEGDQMSAQPRSGPNADPATPAASSADATAEGLQSSSSEQATSQPSAFVTATFCILGQHYEDELVRVRIPVGTTPSEAVEAVSAARDPAVRSYLPRVGHVPIQSLDGIAVLVGLPLWDSSGLIHDHIIAAIDPVPPSEPDADRIFCFVDARPLLLRVECLLAYDGILPCARLQAQYASRCPPGFVLCYFEQDGFVHPVIRDIRVRGFEVVVLTFLPAHFIPDPQETDSSLPPQEDPSSRDDEGPDESQEDGDSAAASQQSVSIDASTGVDAGTGGSRRFDSQLAPIQSAANSSRHAARGRYCFQINDAIIPRGIPSVRRLSVKWNWVNVLPALTRGLPGDTSDDDVGLLRWILFLLAICGAFLALSLRALSRFPTLCAVGLLHVLLQSHGAIAVQLGDTAKVIAIRPPNSQGDSRDFKGRAGFLREQLDSLNIHVAALQETRALASDTITSHSHIRFCSGKDPAGCLGVEIWFSRLLPFLGDRGSKTYFQPGDFLVAFADPRTLVVRFARGSIKILFVCVHGPTTCDPQRESWWAMLHERLHRFSEAHEVVLLGDYNTHFAVPIPGFATELRQTRKILRQAVRQDIQHRIVTVAAEAEHCARTHKGLPLVLTANGAPATTAEEVEDTWVQHFAGIEDGRKVQPAQLAASCMSIQSGRDLDLISFNRDDIPSRIELEAALRATSTGRASGLDGVPGEALHCAVAAASEALYPLLLKTSLRLAEPVQFKGGSLEAAWKGKGSPAVCASHRGILISAVTGKAFHRLLRSRCVGPLASVTSPLQLGGLPSCPVTAVSHSVRLFVAAARAHKQSFAVLFLDLQEAFYRVCRPLLTGAQLSDEAIAKVAATIRLPHGVLHELHLHLTGNSVFEGSGASSWLSGAMNEVLEATWFRFKAGPSLVQTGIGSRPGDNCADIIFSFLFSRVLQELSKDMAARGCTTQLPYHDSMRDDIFNSGAVPPQSTDIFDATWMDDLALMMLSDSAESIVTKAGHVTGLLVDACLSRALLPNLARGKTELIIVPSGTGSKGVRAGLFRDKDPSIEIPSRLWPGARVRVVNSYRHLGGTIHFTGDLSREVRSRVALAHEAFQKRKRHIFGSPTVPKEAKATLYNSLIPSVLLHGAGTWPGLSAAALSSLSSAYERMACHMCRPHWDFDQALHSGRDQVLAYLGLPSVAVLLHIHRLRHLLLFVRLQLGQLWALAHWENDWLATVRLSLAWLWDIVRSSKDMRSWEDIWPEWLQLLHTAPGKWKSLLKRAQARAVHIEAWQAAYHRHCALLVHQLQRNGAISYGSTLDQQDQVHCCALCRTTFSTRQKWSVHAFKCHGRRMAGRGILPGLQCQACLRTYPSNVRLCRHLQYSLPCRAKLLSLGYSCSVEPGVGHRKDDDKAVGLCPALPGSGPLRLFPQLPDVHQEVCPVAEVWDCLRLVDFDGPITDLSDEELWDRLRLSFSCVCASTDRLRATALSWAEFLHATDGSTRLVDCAEWISTTDIVAWLVPTPTVRQSMYRTYRDSVHIIGLLDTSPIQPGSPGPLTPDLVFLRVHSGSRVSPLSLCDRCFLEFTHDECLLAFARGDQPAFFDGPFDDVAFAIDLTGLPLLQTLPCLDSGLSSGQAELGKAILGADLLRFFLRLILLRVPAILVVSPTTDLCIQSVSTLSGIRAFSTGEHRILSNSSDLLGHFCLTPT